jgi:AcrR family transcriptional regulator
MPRKAASVRRKTADSSPVRTRARDAGARRTSLRRPAQERTEPDTGTLSRSRAEEARARPDPAPRLRDDFRNFARASILTAAEEVFALEGLHSARIEEIARRARVAVGTIYNLVGDRDSLLIEIVRLRRSEIVSLLASTLKTHKQMEFQAQLHAFVLASFEYFSEHSRFFRLVMEAQRSITCGKGAPVTHVSQETLQDIRKLYRELMQRGLKQGVLRKDDVDVYPAMLGGMLREVVIHDLESPSRGTPALRAAQVVKMFLQGAGLS